MSNSWFQFKQFMIHQDKTAMKVCTDSCLFGAWTALKLTGVNQILDIGTGTGLLPLMLAQKTEALIDTIESDPESSAQATENIAQSPWSKRIRLIEGDVRQHHFESVYDFIITNPPFFESDLRSPDHKKNSAKHDESLRLHELIPVINSCLKAEGAFSILLPFLRTNYFENIARSEGFFLQEKSIVKQTARHIPFRSMCVYSRFAPSRVAENKFIASRREFIVAESEFIIKDEAGNDTQEFASLMKDYYLP